jgi:hypothetical protein
MPAEISLRLYEELNAHLPPDRRKQEFVYPIDGAPAVGHLLQAVGVPESEVELVLVNGASVDPSYILKPGDRVSVYPVFETLDVSALVRFRAAPLRRLRFVLVPSLCRLASFLRSLGFDATVNSKPCAEEGNRILLTTDPAQLETGHLRAYLVRNDDPEEQLKEVLSRFDLGAAASSGGSAQGNAIS